MNPMIKLGKLPVSVIARRGFHTSFRLAAVTQPTKTQASQNSDINRDDKKLIYTGALSDKIYYLKTFSILSSVTLAGAFGYAITTKGYTTAIAVVGATFTPFIASPFLVAWFFKRYITALYYQPKDDLYTAYHYGLLLNKKRCTFKREDVTRSQVTSIMNTFRVGEKPFFLHDEDLIDTESIELYKRMVGLDKEEASVK